MIFMIGFFMIMNPSLADELKKNDQIIRLFLTGDVMLGRGVDQILKHPNQPKIYEYNLKDARDYVKLAINKNGPLPPHYIDSYVWHTSLEELKGQLPDIKIINLETTITESDKYLKGKGINYRMHPHNIGVLRP